ncbi:MAG: copper amine oxidase N-terminal domain-containing protein [Clostridia bacterium]|nr:copper amine oxidase N-terminal domain-containing protein [Clostridia bacterium]
MMRRIFVFVILAVLFSSTPVSAAEQITVLVDGKKVESEVPAVIVDGYTMLPFRSIFNALGVHDSSIVWDQGSKTIQVNHNGTFLLLVIGSVDAVIEKSTSAGSPLCKLQIAPYIENGRTLVPVRFVSEALEATVDWNQQTKTVTITK